MDVQTYAQAEATLLLTMAHGNIGVTRVLADEAARYGGRVLRRAWREPLAGAPDVAKWFYVLQVSGADVLGVFAGLSGRLWGATEAAA